MTEKILMVVLTQSGEGCDYTIGCGINVERHDPKLQTENEFIEGIMEEYGEDDERGIKIEFFRAEPVKLKKVETVTEWAFE